MSSLWIDPRRFLTSLQSMRVPMVDVRVMRMRVLHRGVVVFVAVRLPRWIVRVVFVLVMLVVNVAVLVGHLLVLVLVAVLFAEMQPNPDRHERCRDEEPRGW